jgi:hypothetical protein
MHVSSQSITNIAGSAHQLQRAAGGMQKRASDPEAVPALPVTLSHLEEALERLSTGAVKLAQAVEDWNGEPDALPPEARALRWHLFHLASRLRGAQEACPETRRWAREVVPQDAASP